MGLWDRVLDRSIVLSFDRTGFSRHAEGFDDRDLADDLTGRVALITGANAGIGRATAADLARRGATVYLLCRSQERGEEARRAIAEDAGHDRVHLEVVDMADLEAVRAAADRIDAPEIHVLVHNAGLLPDERAESPQGHELTYAVHVLGPLALTERLRPRLAEGSRVIFVSSGGMYTQRLDLRDVEWKRRRYDGTVAYAQTKRMQVVLTELLAERWREAGITVHAMHPGWASTRSVKESLPRFYRITRRILRTAEQAADTVIYLAAAKRLEPETGGFWFDRSPAPTHLAKRTEARPEDRAALWRKAHQDAGLDPDAA